MALYKKICYLDKMFRTGKLSIFNKNNRVSEIKIPEQPGQIIPEKFTSA